MNEHKNSTRSSRARKQRARRALLTVAMMLLVAVISIGGTIAWLTASTDPVVNTFTPTDIEVTLTETVPAKKTAQIVPGVNIPKDPKVSANGNVPYYLFVKVTPSDNWSDLVEYTVSTEWTALDPNEYPGVYYMDVASGGEVSATSVLTGDEVTVSSDMTTETMPTTDLLLTFNAYAIQKQDGGVDYDGNFTAAEAWEQLGIE